MRKAKRTLPTSTSHMSAMRQFPNFYNSVKTDSPNLRKPRTRFLQSYNTHCGCLNGLYKYHTRFEVDTSDFVKWSAIRFAVVKIDSPNLCRTQTRFPVVKSDSLNIYNQHTRFTAVKTDSPNFYKSITLFPVVKTVFGTFVHTCGNKNGLSETTGLQVWLTRIAAIKKKRTLQTSNTLYGSLSLLLHALRQTKQTHTTHCLTSFVIDKTDSSNFQKVKTYSSNFYNYHARFAVPKMDSLNFYKPPTFFRCSKRTLRT